MRYFVQLFEVNEETSETHIRVWEVSKYQYDQTDAGIRVHNGDPDHESLLGNKAAHAIHDAAEENAVILNG